MELLEGTRAFLELKAAEEIADELCIMAKKKDVVFAIPGGRSVSGIFSHLVKQRIPWNKVHIFMVDERFVPLSSEQSNFKLAQETFLNILLQQRQLPKEHVHPFTFIPGKEHDAIAQYEKLLMRYGGFDVVLVSSGEDGHIAALYPDHASVRNKHTGFIRVNDSPKPPQDRMTASASLIKKASCGIIVFFGEEKQEAFDDFTNGSLSYVNCPAKLIPLCSSSFVFHTK